MVSGQGLPRLNRPGVEWAGRDPTGWIMADGGGIFVVDGDRTAIEARRIARSADDDRRPIGQRMLGILAMSLAAWVLVLAPFALL